MKKAENNDQVPLFNKWWKWYALVIGFLGVVIVLFSLFTDHFK